jgi:predicted AAA+ superfamily ATPase
MLRYFHEVIPEVHVVAAGSLLEIVLAEAKISFPVGRVQHILMYPLSFQEFLTALGENNARAELEHVPFQEYACATLLNLFHEYALVGGMPEIVDKYREKRDVTTLGQAYDSLLQSYLDDVSRYARNDTMARVIMHCIETAPFSAGTRIKFAGFGRSNYRSREAGEALRTLERAMLIHLLYPTTSVQLPIRPDLKKSPRLQFLDTGLLNYFAGLQEQHLIHADLHSFYQGLLAEHIVGQELICNRASALIKPCFWVREKRQSRAAVDFLIRHEGDIVPVEVKAGKAGRLRSLHQFIDLSGNRFAIRLQSGSMARENCRTSGGNHFDLLNIPYFLASRLDDYVGWMKTGK